MNKIKISIIDAQSLMRRALIYLLKEDQHLDIVSEAESITGLLTILKDIRPDIVLLNLETISIEDQENLKTINRLYPSIKIILLGMRFTKLNKIKDKTGYSYVDKSTDPEFLFKTIYSFVNPDLYFSKPLEFYPNQTKLKRPKKQKTDENALSGKEQEILKYICDGKTNKEIATMFQLATSTVDFHRTKIYGKTKSSNVTDLFKYALRSGLINLT